MHLAITDHFLLLLHSNWYVSRRYGELSVLDYGPRLTCANRCHWSNELLYGKLEQYLGLFENRRYVRQRHLTIISSTTYHSIYRVDHIQNSSIYVPTSGIGHLCTCVHHCHSLKSVAWPGVRKVLGALFGKRCPMGDCDVSHWSRLNRLVDILWC